MAQDYFKINGTKVKQPSEGLAWNWETTYTEDSARTQDGKGHFTTMFTVESLAYSAEWLTISEVKEILQMVAPGKNYTLHYFSPYYGKWMDGTFYTGKGSMELSRLNADGEHFDNLSFNMVGVNPI